MAAIQRTDLTQELEDLFDMKKAKIRDDKEVTQLANEAQKDIKLLTLMFKDEIPDVSIQVTDDEYIRWNSTSQKLLYVHKDTVQLLEATAPRVRIKMRPHLILLVKKAKEFYMD